MATFLEVARKLVLERCISIVPVIPGQKPPGEYVGGRWKPMTGSQEYRKRLPTEDELATWAAWPESGIAVMLGALSGVVGVDFDHRPELHAAIAAFLPETPVKKKGVNGLTHFFRYSGERNRQWKVGGDVVVEILAEHPCTIPPSIHPSGVYYEWVDAGLQDVDPNELPALPEDLILRLDQLFAVLDPKKPVAARPPPAYSQPAPHRSSDLQEVEDALHYVSPEDYDTWTKVGMALFSKFPGPDGFAAWDRWSQRSQKYAKNRPAEMRQKWASFKGEGVTLASLFFMAKEGGYLPALAPTGKPSPVVLQEGGNLLGPKSQKETPPSFALPTDLLMSAPGLVGDVAAWLTVNNFYHQHAYSLAAALAFVGMLKGHQVATEEDARTNLLTIAVGPSSSGKSGPLKGLTILANLAGVDSRMIGEPASEQGLFKAIIDSGHKAFLAWDEIGLAFKSMFAANAQQHRSGIIRLVLKLYSMADTVVRGTQYANHDGKTPRADLIQPCLCLYGTTTAEGIYQAFSSQEAINGFAARLLIFETHDVVAKRHCGRKIAPPEELLAKIRTAAGEGRQAEQGNLVGVTVICPRTVPYSPDARPLVEAAGERFEELKNAAILERRKAEEAIWGRAYEQAIKVALTVEDGLEISAASVRWAVDLVERLCRNMVVAAGERIADNSTHAEVNNLLRLIKEASPNWVSASHLYQQTRGLPRQKRRDHLASLIEEGVIEACEETTGGRKRQLFRYVAPTSPQT